MNEVQRLLWLHNPSGAASSYLLTPAELHEIIKAAHTMGYRKERLRNRA